MAILTLEEYKAIKGINSPNQDATLTPLISMVNTLIASICNQSFSAQEITEYATLEPSGYILLKKLPVNSVTSVSYGPSYGDYTVEYPSTKYYLDTDVGILELMDLTELPTHARAFKVVYSSGFITVPEDIKLAAVELVTHYKEREFKKSAQTSSGEEIQFDSSSEIPMQVKGILNLYRKL